MTKYTKGPWIGCPQYRMVWGGNGSIPVAGGNMGIHSTADVHLIAAAPDMYEALRDLVAACEKLGVTGGNLIAAHAALAKAEGKA